MDFPPFFGEKLKRLWGSRFADWSKRSVLIQKAVRVNTLVIRPDLLKARLEALGFSLSPVPFCDHAFFVSQPLPRSLGSTIEHSLGYFFVQDAASLLPVLALDPKPGERVLDMAAAPGGKATHLAQRMNNSGELVCLDSSRQRLPSLRYSLARFGVVNALVAFESGATFRSTRLFDRVLLDAPCSCEGLGFSDPGVWKHWSETLVSQKSALQKKLILNAFDLLAPGGTMVYSTCTLSPEENEAVVDYLCCERSGVVLEPVSFEGLLLESGLSSWNGQSFDASVEKAARVYSPLTHTESFFIAKIRKGDSR